MPVRKTSSPKLKLDDAVTLLVTSNVFGELIYQNHKTGDEYRWKDLGDTQSLYVSDIRAMKITQKRFLEDNWIVITGIENPEEELASLEIPALYEALQIAQYYRLPVNQEELDQIFALPNEALRTRLTNLSTTMKETIIIRANELIREGILDSISKVRVLEEVLNTELASSHS